MKILLIACALLTSVLTAVPAAAAPEVTPSERVRRNVVVRAAPTTDSEAVAALEPGEEAGLIGEVPGWYQVRLPDGRTGYVSKSWTILLDDVPAELTAAGPFRVHVIDIGTGLATFIEGPDFTMLYDGGSQDDLADGADNRILAYIRAVRPGLQTLDHLVLSHPHKDHLELLPDIFDALSVKHVWDSGRVNKTRGYCRFLKKIVAEPGVRYHNAIASGGVHEVRFTSGGCTGTIRIDRSDQMSAAPLRLGRGSQMAILYRDARPHHDPNGNSIVVRLDLGSRRILMTGDAEGGERELPSTTPHPQSIEAQLLACCRADLRADVLIVGHHGSLTSSRKAFLDAVEASTFVISSGPHAYSGVILPDPEIEAELKLRGRLLQTDLDDEQCEADETKIGPDADESPGGCKNVLISVGTNGALTAAYNELVD